MTPRAVAPVLLPLLLLVGTGLWGIDFGDHWDEHFHIEGLQNALRSRVPLPGFYPYPSMAFWLALASATPEVVAHMASDTSSTEALLEWVTQRTYLLRTRSLFLLVSSLAVVHVYLTVLIWRKRVPEALLAACLIASSWEVAYHLRFITPDGLALSFGALALLGCVAARFQPERPAWLWIAAIGAGLACGSKWTLGLYIVPVVLTGLRDPLGGEPFPSQLRRIVKLGFVFGVTYLISTPGTLFEAKLLFSGMTIASKLYASGHFAYTVQGGAEHLFMILEYLGLVFPSHVDAFSATLSIATAWGVVSIVRESRRLALVMLVFPIVFVAVLSSYSVMLVRNLLPLAPFLAILAARGIGDVAERVGRQHSQRIVLAVVVLVVGINGGWLISAAHSIHSPNAELERDVLAYIQARPSTLYFLSPKICERVRALGDEIPENLSCDPETDSEVFVYLASEGHDSARFEHQPTNRSNLTLTWFGPNEINLDYYSTWPNAEHILVTEADVARAFGFPFEVNLREIRLKLQPRWRGLEPSQQSGEDE